MICVFLFCFFLGGEGWRDGLVGFEEISMIFGDWQKKKYKRLIEIILRNYLSLPDQRQELLIINNANRAPKPLSNLYTPFLFFMAENTTLRSLSPKPQ